MILNENVLYTCNSISSTFVYALLPCCLDVYAVYRLYLLTELVKTTCISPDLSPVVTSVLPKTQAFVAIFG